MRIVHAAHSLAGGTGVQTYALTVADAMQRNGHDVWLCSAELGDVAEYAEALGLRVCADPAELPGDLDAAVAHSAVASHELAVGQPSLPQVFIAHGRFFDNYVPPQIDGRVGAIVTLGAFAAARVDGGALGVRHVTLRQPIDRTRFRERSPIREQARSALLLSNYVEGERLERLRAACDLAGLEFRHVGATGEGSTTRPEDAINAADIVFGKGRAIVEAMACGRAAYVYDMWGNDGWVTPETYAAFEARGFGGAAEDRDAGAQEIAADLARYSPELGAWGAALAVREHAVDDHATALIALCRDAAGSSAPPEVELDARRELARLARVSWRHEGQAHVLSEQMKAQGRRIEQLERELDELHRSRSWRLTAPLRRMRRRAG